jgi:hypothetical protein
MRRFFASLLTSGLVVVLAALPAPGQSPAPRVVFGPDKGVGYWAPPASGISNPTRNRWTANAEGEWYTPAAGTGLWHRGLAGAQTPEKDRWARIVPWRSGDRGVWFAPYPGQEPRNPRKAGWERWTAGSSPSWRRAAAVLRSVGWTQPPGLPPVLWTNTSWGFGVWATPNNGPRPQDDQGWRRVSNR